MVKAGDVIGASCPEGGTFYVCENTGFIGCCTENPCRTYFGTCGDSHLKPTSFDADKYDMIPAQSCFGTESSVGWYTCTGTKPYPFMGCCDINPCAEGSCPGDKVRRSKLSSNKENAQVFLGDDASTTTATTTSARATSSASVASTSATTSETAASTTAAAPTSSPSNDDGGLSHGAVIGIAVGATAAGMLAICLFVFWFWRRARRSREHADASKGPLMGYNAAGSSQSHDSAGYQSQRTPNAASFGTTTSPGSGSCALPNSPQPYYDRTSYQSGVVAPSPEFRSQHGSPPQQWAGSPPTGLNGYLGAGGLYGSQMSSPPPHGAGFHSIVREDAIAELPAEAVHHGRHVSGASELPTNSNTVSLQSYNATGRESEVSGISDNGRHLHRT